VGFRSLTEQIDMMTSGGALIFHVIGALAEVEFIHERTDGRHRAARARS
jgi:DNA invertase Pin-like site-specific DNA recombinase